MKINTQKYELACARACDCKNRLPNRQRHSAHFPSFILSSIMLVLCFQRSGNDSTSNEIAFDMLLFGRLEQNFLRVSTK